jgi:23S rRNA pseudouridine2605 synthase
VSRIRLQKILSRAGLASRREAERLITEGRVTVNGRVAKLGDRADPDQDAVKLNGNRLSSRPPSRQYYLLHKPRGVVTTLKDPEGRSTVADLLTRAGIRQRIYPVGRLDYDAEGLILATNDGDLAQAVLHPSGGVAKIYHVKIRGLPGPQALERLRQGVPLGRGIRSRPAGIKMLRPGSNPWVSIVLHEGRPNQIKRMLESVGHRVLRLKRVSIGPLRLTGLRPGGVRPLRPAELRRLRQVLGQDSARPEPGPLDATP